MNQGTGDTVPFFYFRTTFRSDPHRGPSLVVELNGQVRRVSLACPPVTTTKKSGDRLGVRIVWGMALGLGIGLLARVIFHAQESVMAGLQWLSAEVLDPFGQVFLRMLFFVVVPLIFTSLTFGVVQLGRLDRLGPLAGRTFLLFGVNMSIGVALGLLIMNTVQPGYRLTPETKAQLIEKYRSDADMAQAKAAEQPRLTFNRLVEMFMPRNLLGAVADFQILPLILFAVFVGAAGTQLPADHRRRFMDGLEIGNELMTRIVHFAMQLAPYAVAALMASLVIRVGTDVLQAVLLFVVVVLGGILVHLFGTMSMLLKLLTRRSPFEFFKAIRTVLVTAFSTSSSNATLPTSLQVSRENAGRFRQHGGLCSAVGRHHQHERHRALRRLRRVVRRPGVWCPLVAREPIDALAPHRLQRRRRGGHSRRVAARDGGIDGQLPYPARRHRLDLGRRSVARHGADHLERHG